MIQFKEKVFFITGASSGIGLALALELAPHGARLALCSRRVHLLEDLQMLVGNLTDVLVLPFDVGDFSESSNAVKKTIEKWGRIDYLINNAGIINNMHFHEQTWASIEELNRINYLAPAKLIQMVIPHMLQ